jgi:hypothetical protein
MLKHKKTGIPRIKPQDTGLKTNLAAGEGLALSCALFTVTFLL